jgi:hypothetical protein
MLKVFIPFAVLVAAVVGLSFLSSRLWGGPQEGQVKDRVLVIEASMTVAQFSQRNQLPPALLKRVFDMGSPVDQQRPVAAFGMSTEQIARKTQRLLALRAEGGSKNWVKILVKFGLGLGFLVFMFFLMVRSRVTATNRRWLLLAPVVAAGAGGCLRRGARIGPQPDGNCQGHLCAAGG